MRLTKSFLTVALLLGAVGGVKAETSYTTEVYDFSSASGTITLSTTGTTSTSGTTVYMVTSDESEKLNTTRFAFEKTPSYSKGLVTSDKRSMVSVQGLGIGDIVIVETAANFYVRSKNAACVGTNGSITAITTAEEAEACKIISGAECIVTSGNSFDFYSTSASQRINKITVKKLTTAISEPKKDLDYQFKDWYVSGGTYTSSLSSTAITTSGSKTVYAETAQYIGHDISRMAFGGAPTLSISTKYGLSVAKNSTKTRTISVLDVKKGDYITVSVYHADSSSDLTINEGSNSATYSSGAKATPYSCVISADGTFDMTTPNNSDAYYLYYVTISKAQTMTIGTSNYRTFSSPWAIDISKQSNFRAYYAASESDGVVTMTEITDGIIPANTGVMLYGTSGKFYYTTTTKTISGNLLQPVLSDAQEVGTGYTGKTTYALANIDGTIGYAKLSAASTDMGGKAYLLLSTSASRQAVRISFGDETTGVQSAKLPTQQGGHIFDLQGRHVAEPTKGLYIVNGKKVFIK